MEKYLAFKLENGQDVLVETVSLVADDEAFVPAGEPGLERSSESFEKTIQKIKPVAAVIADTFRALTPDELQIEFGLRFKAKAGVIITSIKSEMNFNVKMTRKNK